MTITTKGRKYSKVFMSELDDSIETRKIKKKSAGKPKAKKKSQNQKMQLLEAMNEMKKMQTKIDEAIAKISNADSDEESSEQSKGLIKMIGSKQFRNSNEKSEKNCAPG